MTVGMGPPSARRAGTARETETRSTHLCSLSDFLGQVQQ